MNLHDGPTGQAFKQERNWRINSPRPRKRPRFDKLKSCPNPLPRRNAIWKHRHGVTA